ncbi:MAG: hypothetical protein JXQ65_04635 [Candidatus Marinimicrobia bacterium]|nr:hypothetical protein [Candidatus Neomarinimicrobiota bacterium]
MKEIEKILERIKNDRYSVNNNKSQELLFTFFVDPEDNLKKLSRIPVIRSFEKGLKFFKIGLYLCAFEDYNAYYFFREARQNFEKADSVEGDEFLSYMDSEKIDENLYLLGSGHPDSNDSFENFKKERTLEGIIATFDIIQKEVLYNNYTSLKSVLRIYKMIEQETISRFKDNLKKYQVAFTIVENSKRKEIIELKDSLKSKRKDNIARKIHKYIDENNLEYFNKKDLVLKSTLESKKDEIITNYRKVMDVIETHKNSQETLSKLDKMKLIKSVEKHNNDLITIGELIEYYDRIEDIENHQYENELAVYMKEIDEKNEKKHEALKDEYKAQLNFRRIFFESIRRNRFGTLFGKDFVRVFSIKEDNYSESILWDFFMKLNICEQDYNDFQGIRNAFEGMRKKLKRIDNKTTRIFEHPDEIFIEIENIENNVN